MENKQIVLDWIQNSGHPWACKMLVNLNQYGSLTEKQLAASERIMNDAKNPPPVQQETLELNAIESAFNRAKNSGIKTPKMTLKHFKFKAAGERSKNPGAIYILDVDHDDQYLGKVLGGKFTLSRDCTPQQVTEIQDIARDPKQAAIAYGKEWGICCVCSRVLTDADSVANGIGPICAERFGWN